LQGDESAGWRQIGERLMNRALLWSGFGWSEVGYATQETINMLL
jgi:hypothetical protein